MCVSPTSPQRGSKLQDAATLTTTGAVETTAIRTHQSEFITVTGIADWVEINVHPLGKQSIPPASAPTNIAHEDPTLFLTAPEQLFDSRGPSKIPGLLDGDIFSLIGAPQYRPERSLPQYLLVFLYD